MPPRPSPSTPLPAPGRLRSGLPRLALALLLLVGGHPALGQEAPGGPGGGGEIPAEIRWDRYHDYAATTALLHQLVEDHPGLASLSSAGRTTMMGREIWVLTVTNRETGPPEEKPAFFLDGGTHAGELGAAETPLYVAWSLLTRYGVDPQVTHLLDTRTFYILPRKDADGMEVVLTGVMDYDPSALPRWATSRGTDGPGDLDGDGHVLQMRVPDPDGEWVISPEDDRIMLRRRPGHPGPFYRLMAEGVDDNGDGQVNSDPPFTRFSSNRNYPGRWSDELGLRRGDGDYPAQEPETRAVVDFVHAHPNIAAMESLHHHGGVILRPFANLEDDRFPAIDLAYYDAIAARGREITGYGYESILDGFTASRETARYGAQVDWGYLGLGILSFTTEQWRYAGNVGPEGPWRDPTPEENMARNDRDFGGAHFRPWTPFQHPQLGPVEIGGWIEPSLVNPPPELLETEVMAPVTEWILHQAAMTPLVRVREVEVHPAGGSFRVVATVANEGFLPTNVTEHAIRAGLARPVAVVLEAGDGVTLLSGEARRTVGHLEGSPPVVVRDLFPALTYGGRNRATVEWLVEGTGEVEVRVVSEKGGTHRTRVRVGLGAGGSERDR
jgi:hypothetical protein